MRIRNNLDAGFGSIADIDTTRNADRADAEVAQAGDHELLLQDNAKSGAGIVANCHVNSKVGLLVAHVQLERSTIDGEVGALLLNIAVASAREVSSRVFS